MVMPQSEALDEAEKPSPLKTMVSECQKKKSLKTLEQDRAEPNDLPKPQAVMSRKLIGQFGAGFGAFMVADKVFVDTLSIKPDSSAIRWERWRWRL